MRAGHYKGYVSPTLGRQIERENTMQNVIEAKRKEVEAKKVELGKIAYNKWAMVFDGRADDTGEKYNRASPDSHRKIQQIEFDLCEEIYDLILEIEAIEYEMEAQ